jgi:hypothetical protein
MSESEINKIVVFRNKNIRRILHQNEWWFFELYERIVQLKVEALDREMRCCSNKLKEINHFRDITKMVCMLSSAAIEGI